MTSYNGHSEECICPACCMADMDAHVAAQGGTIYENEKTQAVETRNRLAGEGTGRGVTRKISDAQARFIRKLLAERDTRNLVLLPGQFIEDAKICTMGVKGGSALIEKLLALPFKPNAPRTDLATEKQIAFAETLRTRKGVTADMFDFAKMTKREISAAIDTLKAMKDAPILAVAKAEEISEGMYRNPETGEIFKVQRAVHGSGNLYAKILRVYGKGEAEFEFASGAIRKLRAEWKMTLDEAKEYGALYGVCVRCSRTLTLESSIEAAMGKICASKF